jgi:hypothetical protein
VTGGFSTGGDGPAPGEVLCHHDLNLQEEVVGQRLGGQLVIQGPNPALLF